MRFVQKGMIFVNDIIIINGNYAVRDEVTIIDSPLV